MNEQKIKEIKDSVHGLIELRPLIVKIIDTPEFQRLRHLKQLETANYVYPCAVHTRFEHSIGTSYLARTFIEHLQKNQPELEITNEEVLCIEIAGLCHDLGHGPFSHMFEVAVNKIFTRKEENQRFKHEEASVKVFEEIYKYLKDDFEQNNLLNSKKELIKFLINPENLKELVMDYEKSHDNAEKQVKKLKIKEKFDPFEIKLEKSFLFEIVSNFRNGIDVDKWDYFARDSFHLGLKNTFDYQRYIQNARVIRPENKLHQICARDKELRSVYEMFRTREDLHRRAYQLPKSITVKTMMVDAFILLNEFYNFCDIAINLDEKLVDYLSLDDRIIYLAKPLVRKIISNDPSKLKSLEQCQEIINRLEYRNLYRVVSKKIVKHEPHEGSLSKFKKDVIDKIPGFHEDDFCIEKQKIDFGNKANDPLEFIEFYNKENKIVDKNELDAYRSQMKPSVFQEVTFILIAKNRKDDILMEQLVEEFENFCF